MHTLQRFYQTYQQTPTTTPEIYAGMHYLWVFGREQCIDIMAWIFSTWVWEFADISGEFLVVYVFLTSPMSNPCKNNFNQPINIDMTKYCSLHSCLQLYSLLPSDLAHLTASLTTRDLLNWGMHQVWWNNSSSPFNQLAVNSLHKGPVMWSFDVSIVEQLLTKKWRCWWFETP